MAKRMTRKMGEALAKKVAKIYGEDPGSPYGPAVNDVWYGPDRLIVAWEGGPYDWPQSDKVADLAPKGWFVEPCNSWSVALYPI